MAAPDDERQVNVQYIFIIISNLHTLCWACTSNKNLGYMVTIVIFSFVIIFTGILLGMRRVHQNSET